MFTIPTPSLRTIAIVLGSLALVGVAVFAFNAVFGGKADQVKGKLDSAVAGAAVTNAADAISVVEDRVTSEQTIERTVIHAQSAVEAATDTAGADAAGRAGLCAITASFCPATGVQSVDPH